LLALSYPSPPAGGRLGGAPQSSPSGELEGAPDTPVKAGIEKFIKWYKSYFYFCNFELYKLYFQTKK
jgi:hypothetical protein